MNEQGRHRFEVQIMRRAHKPAWKWEWGSTSAADAVRECGQRNRAWAAGEAVHRVVERDTGKEVYRRGYLKPFTNQPLKGSQ